MGINRFGTICQQSKNLQNLKTSFSPFSANLASLLFRKIRNFQEIRFSSKPDIMGINRLETMSVVRLTYS
ncbi:hypothetical protein T4C_7430 [Trichinella pseudospiralis]|uniref:Uncharacterized protein n=1 Tax=Trichinella pseudospiralis TaxID=6337 RepID=A0A0V1GTN4_TRIPS|nr:hypothetical protein T4C_7430 [Trichinella pseudospiralis]